MKTADVGLSLSEAEASIAAPFTSKRAEDISSVVVLIEQGRASLDLSYTLFKYVMVYSAMNFSSMVILHYHTSDLHDNQFGYINVFLLGPCLLGL